MHANDQTPAICKNSYDVASSRMSVRVGIYLMGMRLAQNEEVELLRRAVSMLPKTYGNRESCDQWITKTLAEIRSRR